MLFMGNFKKIALIGFLKLDEINLTSSGRFFMTLLKTNLGYLVQIALKACNRAFRK